MTIGDNAKPLTDEQLRGIERWARERVQGPSDGHGALTWQKAMHDLEWLATIAARDEEIARLRDWKEKARRNPECIHCGGSFAAPSHWESCEAHPARARLAQLEVAASEALEYLKAIHANSDDGEEATLIGQLTAALRGAL